MHHLRSRKRRTTEPRGIRALFAYVGHLPSTQGPTNIGLRLSSSEKRDAPCKRFIEVGTRLGLRGCVVPWACRGPVRVRVVLPRASSPERSLGIAATGMALGPSTGGRRREKLGARLLRAGHWSRKNRVQEHHRYNGPYTHDDVFHGQPSARVVNREPITRTPLCPPRVEAALSPRLSRQYQLHSIRYHQAITALFISQSVFLHA
jgi:hypothetical protein